MALKEAKGKKQYRSEVATAPDEEEVVVPEQKWYSLPILMKRLKKCFIFGGPRSTTSYTMPYTKTPRRPKWRNYRNYNEAPPVQFPAASTPTNDGRASSSGGSRIGDLNMTRIVWKHCHDPAIKKKLEQILREDIRRNDSIPDSYLEFETLFQRACLTPTGKPSPQQEEPPANSPPAESSPPTSSSSSGDSGGSSSTTTCSNISLIERLSCTHSIWMLPDIQRAGAFHLLQDKEVGTFIVRRASFPQTMALSVRLPHEKGLYIEHYLIIMSDRGTKIRLDTSELRFSSMPEFIAHYVTCCDELPIQLRLPKVIQQAKTRQELNSYALLGQEFWTYSPPTSSASTSSRTSTPEDIVLTMSTFKTAQDQKPIRPNTLNLALSIPVVTPPPPPPLPHPPAHWLKPKSPANTPEILSPAVTEQSAASKHYQESDIVDSPMYFRSNVSDKASDYEDVWTRNDAKNMPEATTKKEIYADPADCVPNKRNSNPVPDQTVFSPTGSERITSKTEPITPVIQLSNSVDNLQLRINGSVVKRAASLKLKAVSPPQVVSKCSEKKWKVDKDWRFIVNACNPNGPNPPQPDQAPKPQCSTAEDEPKTKTEENVEEKSFQWEEIPWETDEDSSGAVTTKMVTHSFADWDSIVCSIPKSTGNKKPLIGDAIRRYTLELAGDKTSTFAKNIFYFLTCTVRSKQTNPQIIMRNMRQFMSGMKNYLVSHGERDLHKVIQEERTKLKATEFLNLDALLEDVMHHLVVRPLRNHLERLLVIQYKGDGSYQLWADSIEFATTRPFDELGLQPFKTTLPSDTALNAITDFVRRLIMSDSLLEKFDNLMAIVSVILQSVKKAGCQLVNVNHLAVDDFLLLLVWVLVQTNFVTAELEADIMLGLLHPSLLAGEGGYYLTALSSAVHVLRNVKNGHVKENCKLRKKNNGVIKIVVPDELHGSILTKTLPARPSMTTKEMCKIIAHKARITNPQDYALYCLRSDGEETMLQDNDHPEGFLNFGNSGKECRSILTYKRIEAKIAWPNDKHFLEI